MRNIRTPSHRWDWKRVLRRTGLHLSSSLTSPVPSHTISTSTLSFILLPPRQLGPLSFSPALYKTKGIVCSLSTPSSSLSSLSLVTGALLASPLLFISLCGPCSCCQTAFNVLWLSLFSLSSLHVPPVCCCSCLLPGWVGYLYATGLHLPPLPCSQRHTPSLLMPVSLAAS